MDNAKVKASELRLKKKSELLETLKKYRNELATLRVAKVTGGAPNKLMKIHVVRRSIARVLTVYREQQKKQIVEYYQDQMKKSNGKKVFLPLDLRRKKTRAIRRQLKKSQKFMKTQRQRKLAIKYPKRQYFLKK